MVDESSWLYSDYNMGDVVIFDIRTIHASFRSGVEYSEKLL